MKALIQAFLYDAGNIFWNVYDAEEAKSTRNEEIFMHFIGLVEKHFKVERRVTWYALQLHMTPKHLSETIKKVSRQTPGEWIDNYVVMELRVQIKNSRKSIKQIAMDMNFPSQSFMGKYFKEHVGMSPTEYRRS